MAPSPLFRARAERLLAGSYRRLQPKVLAAVRARLGRLALELDRLDLEACYAQAWHGLYNRLLAGERIDNPAGWLVVVTERRAREELRLRRNLLPLDGEPGSGGSARLPDPASALESRNRLRELFEGLALRLNRRERQAVALCYLQGLTRAEAAKRMGISERRLQRLLEGKDGTGGATRKLGEVAGIVAAERFCDHHRSLMQAYAFGLLDPAGERYTVAIAHQRACPACAAYVRALRGLAAVLPPPPLGFAALFGGFSLRAGAAGAGTAAPTVGQSGLAGLSAGAIKAACAALVVGIGGVATTVQLGASDRRPARPRPAPAPPAAPRATPAVVGGAVGGGETTTHQAVAVKPATAPPPRPAPPPREAPIPHAAREFGFEGPVEGRGSERPSPVRTGAVARLARKGKAPPREREFSFEGAP